MAAVVGKPSSALEAKARSAGLAVVILTYNEELNVAHALASVAGWADEIFVLDSFSTDRTLEIAAEFPCNIQQHAFADFGSQRNFALRELPIRSEWVFFLDADEWMPDALKQEIAAIVARSPAQNGFFVKWRMMWMGRWIHRGYYPSWILRLMRREKARFESRTVNEHVIVEGEAGYLANDFIHEDRKEVHDWIAKHNGYATREALELLRIKRDAAAIEHGFWSGQRSRKRWIRNRVWNRLPPLVRPFLYFFYRYVLAGGFLDGRAGLVYHFLQALWFPFLIDVKYIEMKREEAMGRKRRV
jgi:glycosyltransferase involved in cell wall biosynthesis